MAAPSAALTLEKLVDKSVLVPGETAVYELKPGCDSPTTLCENGVLTDEIPEPLVVEDVQVVGGGASEVDRDGNNITVRFLDVHTNGAIGLKDGSTPTVYITVRLPQSTPPEMNGTVLTNSAEVTADNADPKQADVDIKLEVPVTLGAVVDKAWGADSVPTGTTQDISLSLTGIANNSNIGANALELREPSGDFNPFDTVAITELKGVTLPEGADIGQIFVTTEAGETAGEASASPALPAGVDPADIIGLRVVFSDSAANGQIVPGGAGGSVELLTQLRSGVDAERVDNQVSVTASTPQGDSEPATAEDSFTIAPAQYRVQASKNIDPGTIATGGDATVEIEGVNRSNQSLDTMTLTEPAGEFDFFGGGVKFKGFADTDWPSGATAGSVKIGGTAYELTQAEGKVVWPSSLTGDIENFIVEFTGTFAPGDSISSKFTVTGLEEGTYLNTVEAGGSVGGDPAEPATANAELTVQSPSVTFDGRKFFVDDGSTFVDEEGTPSAAVIEGRPGESITAILQGWISSKNIGVHAIVVEDVFNDDFKDGFDATELRIENDLGAGSVLVEHLVDGEWTALEPDEFGAYSLSADSEGVRVTFGADLDGPGFAETNRVQVAIDFEVAKRFEETATLKNVVVIGPGNGEPGTPGDGESHVEVDPELHLGVAKEWVEGKVVVTPADPNPTSAIKLTAQNTSAYAVDFLGISEPGEETDAFEYVNATGLTAVLHGNAAGVQPAEGDAVLTLYFADGEVKEIKGASALNPVDGGIDWPNVVGFDFALDSESEAIPRGASFEIKVTTELRSHTRTGNVAIDEALGKLDPAYTIPNQVDAEIRRGTATDEGSAQADLQVETTNSVDIEANVVKTFQPESGALRKPGGAPNEIGVQFALAPERDRADTVTFEDVDPTFWNAFDFQSWSSFDVAYWAERDRIQLDLEYLVGATFATDNERSLSVTGGEWVAAGPFSIRGTGLPEDFGAGLPAGVDPGEVQGVRLTIETTDHSALPGTWNEWTERDDYSVDFVVNPRLELRSGGANADMDTPNPGEEEAAIVVNDLTGTASRLGGTAVSDEDDATFTFIPGRTSAEVSKTDNGAKNTSTTAGGLINYTLSVTNTGAEPMVDPVIRDVLPTDAEGPQLLFSEDGTVEYSVDPEDASITTNPEEITITEDYESAEPSIAITFPEGSVLLPGETYTVNLPVVVRAGHQPARDIVNTLQVTSGGSDTVWEDTALVNVLAGQAYESRKLVREVVPEGTEPTGNVIAQGAPENSICHDYGDGFYRYPCVVETQPGGQAEWKITVTNTGNVVAQELEILDILPWVGDKHVVPSLSSFDRGTEWKPTLAQIADPLVPEGTTVTAEYLTGDPAECVPTGANSDPWQGCDAAERWTIEAPADLAEISAIKWTFAFDEGLKPTEGVTVSFITDSDLEWPEGFDRAPEAWNSFAYKATAELNNRTDYRVQEPNKTGITFREPDPTYAIGDFVWIDANSDGVQDEGEEPLEGVTVELRSPAGEVIATTTTDERGRYFFDELPAGEYQIQFTLTPEQAELYEFTTHAAGEDDGVDSDADPDSGGTGLIVLDETNAQLTTEYDYFDVAASEGIDPTWDAGVVLKPEPEPARVSVGDYVWVDTNGDGLQDDGEPGLPGVVLVLTGPDGKPVTDVYGNLVDVVTTDANGKYTFEDLPVLTEGESYTVSIDREASAAALAPYVPTIEGAGDDRGRDSSTWTASSAGLTQDGDRDPTLDFGFVMAEEPGDPTPTPGDTSTPQVTPTLDPVQDPSSVQSPETPGQKLPDTGVSIGGLALAGIALLVGFAILISRRRWAGPRG